MKRLILVAGPIEAAAISMAMFSAAAASADEYSGETYADAAAAIEDGGGTPVVATRVGDKLERDDCIVTDSSTTSFVRPMTDDVYFEGTSDEVLLNLNCAGGFATATNPGASSASPAGREAKAAAEEAASQSEEELAEVSTPDE